MTRKHAVYELWVDGALAYVGCSHDPDGRFANHKAKRKVPRGAELRIVKWYPRRGVALIAEAARIAELNPPLNKLLRQDVKEEKKRKAYDAEVAKWEAVAEANRKKVAEIEADIVASFSSTTQSRG